MASRGTLQGRFVRQELGRALLVLGVVASGVVLLSTACTNARSDKPLPTASSDNPAVISDPQTSGLVEPAASVEPALPNTPEGRLLRIIQLVELQELDAALQAAAKLTEEIPNFRAAQLVYADLLGFKTGKQPGMASTSGPGITEFLARHRPSGKTAVAPVEDVQAQLQGLRKELQRRVHGVSALPAAGSVPRELQGLGASVRHALVIDASKSRLYLYAQDNGQLRLIGDFYVSIGKLGMGKSQEGDQRTPQGVYFIGREIPGPKLPNFYGKGALTLNYPNDWDKTLDRSGSGIWLHGSPPDQYARLPEASDGCIVLANNDLIEVMKTVDRHTPVLIRDNLQWVAASERAQQMAADPFRGVLDTWQHAWKKGDQRALEKIYARTPKEAHRARTRLTQFFRAPDTSLQNLSVYAWNEKAGDVRIVDMQVRSAKSGKSLPLRQYWRKSGPGWEIFSEEVRG